MNRLTKLLASTVLFTFAISAMGAATWQNISYSTNPVTYTIITNLLGFTGSTATYLRSDGTQATPVGGGGYSPFTNISGVVQFTPGQAETSVLSIVSGLSDNATNVALEVKANNSWTGNALLANFRNGTSNVLQISQQGTLVLGHNTLSNFWSTGLPVGEVLTAISYPDLGDENYQEMYFQVVSGDLSSFAGAVFDVWSKTNEINLYHEINDISLGGRTGPEFYAWVDPESDLANAYFQFLVRNTKAMGVYPTILSAFNNAFVDFNTHEQFTNGYTLFRIRNADNVMSSVEYDGSITTGGNTNRWIFKGLTVDGGATNAHCSVNGTNFFWELKPE